MARTTVFQSGNSQAVRLPKEFRFNSKTVEIFRRGDEVVLRENPRTVGDVLDEINARFGPVTDAEAEEIDRALKDVRDLRPVEERDGSWLSGDEKPPAAKRPRKPRVGK